MVQSIVSHGPRPLFQAAVTTTSTLDRHPSLPGEWLDYLVLLLAGRQDLEIHMHHRRLDDPLWVFLPLLLPIIQL